MRWAFVLQLGSGTAPLHQHIEGWIEEVDTGRELRFRSADELLTFLFQCFESAQHRCRVTPEGDKDVRPREE
jgi:hypothetical protein